MIPKLYYPEPLEGIRVFPAFEYKYPAEKGGKLFRDLAYSFFKEAETNNIESADAIVLVNNFSKIPDESTETYIRTNIELAEKKNIPLYLFSCGDWTDGFSFDSRAWVFRYSVYASRASARDIVVPSPTENPPSELLFSREKTDKPIVAFVGQGSFSKKRQWVKYFVQNVWLDFLSLFMPIQKARKIGVYWRRAMMRSCEQSPALTTNFVVRGTSSLHKNSIEVDPAKARKEYLEASANADFVLAPKGDGNYSLRFYKTLAFGRVPVLVDTDVLLPLEDTIPYEKIIVRVPMNDVHNTAKYVSDFYVAHTEEEWLLCQKLARETFTTYLAQDTFFKHFFTHKIQTGKQ